MLKKLSLSIIVLFVTLIGVQAQGDPTAPLPQDPALRKGVLENGLTYYIRHNAKPEGQGEFFIFDKVGAMQEEDAQIGLAHFLEHMAFNGTKNFPKKDLMDYLSSIGVKFGANLNAGTGQEITQYEMSSVPVTREGIIDTCLLILHDWAYYISLEEEEIDNERGVILEELRTRNTADWRIREKSMPYLYGDTRYAKRNVIGTVERLKTFTYDEIRDFYHRWYNTKNQCLVIVGDFDVDMMENKVKTLFSTIPAVVDAEEIAFIPIPDNVEPIIGVVTDPELSGTSVDVYIKRAPMPKEMNNTMVYEMYAIVDNFIQSIIVERLSDIAQKPNAPFVSAYYSSGSLTNSCDVSVFEARARDGESLVALEALYSEMEKVRRFGFTQSEFERAQAKILRSNQRYYDNRNDRRSSEFIHRYTRNFVKNTPIWDIEAEWKLDSTLITSLDVNTINMFAQQARITPTNQVVLISTPDKDGISVPTDVQIAEVLAKVNAAELEAYVDNTVVEPLIPVGTKLKGSRVKKTEVDKFGSTIWTLRNGIKVVVKPTDFKADEIVGSVISYGGKSVLSDSEISMGDIISQGLQMMGVGNFSRSDLQKQLAGKVARVSPFVGQYTNGFSTSCSPKDLETMMQLLYLNFNSPRFNEDDYNVAVDQLTTAYANMGSNPNFKTSEVLMSTLYANNPRTNVFTVEAIENLAFDQVESVFEKLYSKAGDFTFTFVGNINLDEFKPLVEKYIGSLPRARGKYTYVDNGIESVKGVVENRFEFPMQMPQTTVIEVYTGKMPYTLKTSLQIQTLAQILDLRYTESIREEKGGTYGVGVQAQQSYVPENEYLLLITFDTNKEMADELMAMLLPEIEKIANEGPTVEDLAKVKEFYTKQHPDDLKKNRSWIGWLNNYYIDGSDMTTGYELAVEELSGDDIKEMAKIILRDNNLVKVIMDPAPVEEEVIMAAPALVVEEEVVVAE